MKSRRAFLAFPSLLFLCVPIVPLSAYGSNTVSVTTTPAPYVPEKHDGFSALVREGATVIFDADFSSPVTQWTQTGKRGRTPARWTDLTASKEAQGSFGRILIDGVPAFRIEAIKASAGDGAFQAGISLGKPQAGDLHLIRLRFGSALRTSVRVSIVSADGGTKPLWSRTATAGTEAKLAEFAWVTPVGTGPVNLLVGLETMGECNITALTVETIGRDRLTKRLGAPEISANALRATRFPLGLPSRWSLDRATSEDERPIEANPAVPGPSGAPSLHIPPAPSRAADQARAEPVTLSGEPFGIARYWEPQVASLSAKGAATVTVSVRHGFDTLATETFKVSEHEGWRRLALSFHPLTLTDEYYLQIKVDGELWMDGLRVAIDSGTAASSYVPSPRAEVAISSPSLSRVVFTDDPADAPGGRVEWAVLPPAGGFTSDNVLRAKVVNLYDQQLSLPDAPLSRDGILARGHWTLPEFPGKPFGAHRIEAWVEDRTGKRLSAVDELVVYRLPRPRYWGRDGEESFFGIHVTSISRHLQLVKAAGVNWVRLHDAGIQYIGWHFLEKERGQWTWEDAAIRRYRAHHLMILGQFGTTPAWASALGRVGKSGWLDRYYMPEDKDAWQNYVRTVTKRYRDQIHYWDVWNEPWSVDFGKSDARVGPDGRYHYLFGENPPAFYAELTRITAATARAIDPDVKIVGLNSDTGGIAQGTAFTATTVPARRYPGADWSRLVSTAGGLEGANIIGYHQYLNREINVIGYEDDWVAVGNERAIGLLKDPDTGRPPLPVWMKEGTAVQGLTGRGFYYHGQPFPDVEDRGRAASDQLLRYVASVLSHGVDKTFLYSSHKYGFADDGVRFRVLLSEDGSLHPSAVAYAALARRIDGRPFVKTLQLTPETRAYVFADRAGADWSAVIVPRTFDTPSTVALKSIGALQADDIFGNPLPPETPAPRGVFFVGGKGAFADASLDPLQKNVP